MTTDTECPGYWCPGQHGGDHDHSPVPFVGSWMPQEVYAPLPDHPANATARECWFCHRPSGFEDVESLTVTLPDGSRGVVCGRCVEKSDVGPDVPLDYQEYEGGPG